MITTFLQTGCFFNVAGHGTVILSGDAGLT